MHVALNALPITNRSGTGRYCWGLIHGFISEFSNDARLSIAIPASFSIPNEWRHKKNIHFYSIPISSTIQRIAWEQWALPSFVKKLQCDMLHSPAFIAPVLGRTQVKQIVTIHDLAYERFPQTIPSHRLCFYRWAVPRSIQRADTVLTDSQTIADEFERSHDSPKRIIPIHLGIDPAKFQPNPTKEDHDLLARFGLTPNYFLFVGTLEPRKNLSTLLQAYSHARERGLKTALVIAGRLGWMQKERAFNVPGVHAIGHVSDNSIPALYRHARALIAPSLYEGFDLPVIEAQACGTPVIASDIPVHREILDECARFIPVENVTEWSRALVAFENNPLKANPKKIRGWSETAADTYQVYQSVYASR